MSIKALFLDFGNVFSTFHMEFFYRRLIREGYTTLPARELNQIQNDVYRAFDRGDISPEDYYHEFMARTKIEIPQALFEEYYTDIFFEDVAGLDTLLEKVRTEVVMYLLSNTNEIHYERYFKKHPFLFKHIPGERHILSYRVGASKPEPRIYEYALKLAGVRPDEAILVDDYESNINSWKNLGGHGIVYHGFHHDIGSLEKELQEHDVLK
ncbi:MAG: HAD family phosphatase [Patescibacteria group bacterium]